MNSIPIHALAMLCSAAFAGERSKVVCTYAPSQSAKVAAVAGVASGGAAATAGAVAAATGLTAVVHSSGALILTGSSGYIAGTIGGAGAAVAAAPFIVGVGILVGGAVITVELVCARQNHPEQVAKIQAAAREFGNRFRNSMHEAEVMTAQTSQSVRPVLGSAAAKVKKVSGNVWRYAFRHKTEQTQLKS